MLWRNLIERAIVIKIYVRHKVRMETGEVCMICYLGVGFLSILYFVILHFFTLDA